MDRLLDPSGYVEYSIGEGLDQGSLGPALGREHIEAMGLAKPNQNAQDASSLSQQDWSAYSIHQLHVGVGVSQESRHTNADLQTGAMQLPDSTEEDHLTDQGTINPAAVAYDRNDPMEPDLGLNPPLSLHEAESRDVFHYCTEFLAAHNDNPESNTGRDFSTQVALEFHSSPNAITSLPASQRKNVFRSEHPISGASDVNTESNHGQDFSAQPAFFSIREVFAKIRNARSAASLVEPKSSRDLHAQLRRNTKLVKRAEVRKNDLEQEQPSPVRRIYEIKTEGVVACANPEVQEGETEVKTAHFFLEKMVYTAFYVLDVASGFLERSVVHL